MKTFDIFSWQPPQWPEPHPAIVVSHPDRTARKDWIEVILASTKEARQTPAANEFILDTADGLDWPTIVKCDLIYAVPRGVLKHRRGEVIQTRRGPLLRTVLAAHGWAAWF